MVASYIPYYLLYDDGAGIMALISSCYDLLQGAISSIAAIVLYHLFLKVKLPYNYSNLLNYHK